MNSNVSKTDPMQEILETLANFKSRAQMDAGDYLTGTRASRVRGKHMAEAYDHAIQIMKAYWPNKYGKEGK